MPDFPSRLARANTNFRHVLHTGKTSQVSAVALKDRETAMFGGVEDQHFLVVAGKLKDGSNVHGEGHILTINGGSPRELAAEGDVKLIQIGGIETPEGFVAPTREAASEVIRQQAREFNTKQRNEAAKSGAAMKDGSFPIYNQHDLNNAADLLHHADDVPAARAHIVQRAKDLGLQLPYSMRPQSEMM